MRCRAGDLAVVVWPGVVKPAPCQPIFDAAMLGRIVRCVRLEVANNGTPCWALEEPITVKFPFPFGTMTITAIGDRCLRPLRDPGDDAVDETLVGRDLEVPA